ncbi:MAG: nicotinamide riboside transporter PnuC [Sphingobacteriaceae bacterium]|nr:nicotinamide riboside transporter PnuC [Sphingobacteriaceae bacterium]
MPFTLSLVETTAAIFGVLSVILARYAHIGVFPTGLVSTLLYIYICFGAGLYADMGVNAWYASMSVYGWWRWTRPVAGEQVRPIAFASRRDWRVFGLLSGGSLLAIYFLLARYTDSTVPLADAFTTAVAIGGMYLMAEKKVENWLAWIVVDVASIFLYAYKGLPVSSMQFVFFTILALWGWHSWQKVATAAPEVNLP